MTIIQQPDALSLSGNLKKLRISSAQAVSFTLSEGGDTLLEQSYEPNDEGLIEIDLREVVADRLSYDLRDTGSVYEQASIVSTFTASVAGSVITFRVVRGGVYKLQDSATNFLTANFLTWQPNQKRVTYYQPEFLTYYAVVACSVKLKAYFTDESGDVTSDATISVASLTAGKAYTIPLQYATVAGLLSNRLPAFYDVWVENGSAQRLTYIQRYIADSRKSLDEDWILWENSLGGLDTMRAYGDTELAFKHEHHEAVNDGEALEYHVDTDRLYRKDTGKLSKAEARWLTDFMPSRAKYVYLDNAIRSIVVTDSSVSGKVRTEPVSFSFTYKLSDTACLLNHGRTEVPTTVLGIVVPDLGNFTLAPRLSEFPSQTLSGGTLFPVQSPYGDTWGTASLDALADYFGQAVAREGTVPDGRYLRKTRTHPSEPSFDTEELQINFLPKQEFRSGFRSIYAFTPGVAGKGTDLTIVNTYDNGAVVETNDIFTTDFVVARKRMQSAVGLMAEAEFGSFIDGGSGFVSSFESSDGVTADGRGAKIYANGNIESATINSRGSIIARGVTYNNDGDIAFLPGTGEVIGYQAVQAGARFIAGAAGSGVRFNGSGHGEISSLNIRQYLSNSGIFADGFFGEGFKVWNDGGTWKMTIDQLTVRQIMNVYELLVNRIRAVGGMLVVSPSSGKVKSVEEDGDFLKIRFESGNDSFQLHDLIRMQTFTGEDYRHNGVGQVVAGWWCEVLRTDFERVTNHDSAGILEQTEQLVWVSKDDIGLWCLPMPGDECVTMGNTQNPARQSLIALTANESTVSDGQGGQVGTPTIDILTGVDRRNFSGTSRTRLGYLGDVTDTAFYNITTGLVENPQGYGLYSDNAYLKGRFVLADGSDVYTMFSVQSGRFESAIGNISTSVMTDRENYLYDAAFANRLAAWATNGEAIYFQQPLNSWVLANGGLLSYHPHKVTLRTHGGIRTVDITNGRLSQLNASMSRRPNIMEVSRTTQRLLTVDRARTSTDSATGQENYQTTTGGALIYDTYVVMEDGTEVLKSLYDANPGNYSPAYTTEYVYDQAGAIQKDKSATPVWLTFMIAVETAGTLAIGFEHEETTGFSSFTPFSVSQVLDPTGEDSYGNPRYVEKSYHGYWSGTGDFVISFTGKASIYGLRLWSDMELQYLTRISQTDERIQLEAQARNAMGDAYRSLVDITAKQIKSIVASSDGRISSVKQTADSVSAEVASARTGSASLKLRIDGISTNVSTISGDLSSVQQTANSVSVEVANARSGSASLKLRIDGIASDVSSISGSVSSLQQTANSLTGYVGSFTAGSTLAGALSAIQTAAQNNAAADATSKMNSAISTAASDAQSKATAALNSAKGYADGLDSATRTFVTSGFVAQSDLQGSFNSMYSAAVAADGTIQKTANMGTYVTWDPTTHQIASGAVINADQITFTGRNVTVKNTSNVTTFSIDSNGNVSVKGTVDASAGYIGNMSINNGGIGSASIPNPTYGGWKSTSRFNYGGLTILSEYWTESGSLRKLNEAFVKIHPNSSPCVEIKAGQLLPLMPDPVALAVEGKVNITGDLSLTGSLVVPGSVGGASSSSTTSLPASAAEGTIIFVLAGTVTSTSSDIIPYDETTGVSSVNIGNGKNERRAYIRKGSYWYELYFGD